MSIQISGFSDEISDDLDQQLSKVKELSMHYISLRGIDGKNIADFSLEEFRENVLPRLEKAEVNVSSIGSPIGKVFLEDEEGFAKQLQQLETLCEIAKLLQCKYIRVFSFFMTKGENYDDHQEKVVEKIKQFAQIAQKHQVILLHENEKDIFGDIARRCKILFEKVDSPYFQGIFDFANFVQCGEDTLIAYHLLKENLLYYHIKDASYEVSYNVLCGTGDGKIPEILSQVIANGYDGFLTLEPHLAMFGSLQSLELEEASSVVNEKANLTGAEGYEMQYKALVALLKESGVNL